MKQLGCNIITDHLKIYFTLSSLTIDIVSNPAHMNKMVWNTFGEKNILIDDAGEKIDFNYIKQLLQNYKNFYLVNKLKI